MINPTDAVRPGTRDALTARTIDATVPPPLVRAQETVVALGPRIAPSGFRVEVTCTYHSPAAMSCQSAGVKLMCPAVTMKPPSARCLTSEPRVPGWPR